MGEIDEQGLAERARRSDENPGRQKVEEGFAMNLTHITTLLSAAMFWRIAINHNQSVLRD